MIYDIYGTEENGVLKLPVVNMFGTHMSFFFLCESDLTIIKIITDTRQLVICALHF